MDQDNLNYRKAAEALLQKCDGDFVAVGASPISVLMHMESLDNSRSYTYVPFTGFWLRHQGWPNDTTCEFARIKEREPVLMSQYQNYLHNLGLTPRRLSEAKSPINLVDVRLTGVGLTSFADVILEDAKSVGLESEVASNILLVGLSDNPNSEITQIWPAKSESYHSVTYKNIKMDWMLYSKIIHSREYHRQRPRLTLEYPPEAWSIQPQPAAPNNLSAYNQLASSLGLDHLVV